MTPITRFFTYKVIVLASLILMTSHVLAQGADDKSDAPLPLEGKTEKLEFSTTEGSWLSIDIMPDGETLLFDLLGDLYSLPISGGQANRISSGLGFDSQPAVSPDGEWIAFVSDRSGSNNLWIS
jgi:Tol biopolymer transport system component